MAGKLKLGDPVAPRRPRRAASSLFDRVCPNDFAEDAGPDPRVVAKAAYLETVGRVLTAMCVIEARPRGRSASLSAPNPPARRALERRERVTLCPARLSDSPSDFRREGRRRPTRLTPRPSSFETAGSIS